MNNWFIESISLAKDASPSKEEMEGILNSINLKDWEIVEKYSGPGSLWIKIGHISPAPRKAAEEGLNYYLTFPSNMSPGEFARLASGLATSKYDFLADLRITFVNDENKSLDDDIQRSKQLLEMYGEYSQKLSKEELSSLKELTNIASEIISSAKEVKFLNERARAIVKDGKKAVTAVFIGNFTLNGTLLAAAQILDPGSKPIHAIACRRKFCERRPACSNLKAEGFIHREMVELLLKEIFTGLKGNMQRAKQKAEAELIRGKHKIHNLKENSGIEKGDIIRTSSKTQINLADRAGNKITIGGNTELKIETVSNLKLMAGTVTAFLKKLKPKSKFEVHTPTAIAGVRGTAFSMWTDSMTTTLTVVEGEVEFSDLKNNKVIVTSNQTCICSKEQGIQKPVKLPVNLKKQLRNKDN